ncbi:hypothetical protein GQ457_06G029810 [Hibiscus cannabinus]
MPAALSWNIPMTNEEGSKEYKKNDLVQNYSGRDPSKVLPKFFISLCSLKHKHIINDSKFGIWKVLLFVGEIVPSIIFKFSILLLIGYIIGIVELYQQRSWQLVNCSIKLCS